MNAITIAVTGGTGAMGSEVIRALLNANENYKVKALVLPTAKDKGIARKLKRKYGCRLEPVLGDLESLADCKRLVEGSDYVFHMGAIIPPKADHSPRTMAVNYGGTVNMVNATLSAKSQRGEQPKFIHTSSVAVYGNRNYKHPWGRVGDPLLPSPFDIYAASKLRGELYVMESDLTYWTVLRQTALLHKDLLMNNIKDGLMFHTCWNAPLEWVTAEDSGRLCANIVARDVKGETKNFWKRCFDIGGGASCRLTGYDTFNDGFKIIGGSAESFLEPPWNMNRNFHGVWFAGSDELNDMFDFRRQSESDFWSEMAKKHPIYQVARILPPKLIKKLVIERLLSDSNSPGEWIRKNDEARVLACFGSTSNIDLCPKSWKDFPLLAQGRIADGSVDYEEMRNIAKIKENGYLLSHGYDEDKPDGELDISDMEEAAKYRGGKCLSKEMKKGDLYTKLLWEFEGTTFEMRPYTVLKAGHWCPELCEQTASWDFDMLAKKIPFFAQIWYDTHAKRENVFYYYEGGRACYFKKTEDGLICKA